MTIKLMAHSRHTETSISVCHQCAMEKFSTVWWSGRSDASFTIGDSFVYVASVLCECGQSVPINRFTADNALATGCCACKAALPLRRFETHRTVHSSIAQPILHRPLGQVGVSEANCVVVRRGDKVVLFDNGAQNGRGP